MRVNQVTKVHRHKGKVKEIFTNKIVNYNKVEFKKIIHTVEKGS